MKIGENWIIQRVANGWQLHEKLGPNGFLDAASIYVFSDPSSLLEFIRTHCDDDGAPLRSTV